MDSEGKQPPGELSGEAIRKGLHLWGSAEGIEGHFVQAAWKHLSRRASTWLGLQSALRRQHSGGLRASFQSWK